MEPMSLKRDTPDYPHYRQCRAGTRAIIVYLPAEAHAALAEWARSRRVALQSLGTEAIREWAEAHGVALEGGAAQQDGARSA